MKLRTILVEDELMARKSLEKLCKSTDIIDLVDSFESPEKALPVINKDKVDLLFLDIEMPGLTGLELLDHIDYMPQVVFTTSKKEYAYDAFEYDVTDFIKKPVTSSRFSQAVEKVKEQALRMDQSGSFSSEREIYLKQDGRLIRVPYEAIYYFENVGDYIKVHTEMGNFIIYGALKSIDAKLDYAGFLKVHRSYIINLSHIKDIEDNTLVIQKAVIPISRAHKPLLLKTINIL